MSKQEDESGQLSGRDHLISKMFGKQGSAVAEIINNNPAYNRMKEHVRSVLDGLTDREATVLELRFGLTDGKPRTLVEAGRPFGMPKSTVWDLEARVFSRFRTMPPDLDEKLKELFPGAEE